MGRPRTWTDAQLRRAVKKNKSVAGVIRDLGLRISGGVYEHIYLYVKRLNLSTDHFTGQGWSKGKRGPNEKAMPLSEILVKDRPYPNNSGLRARLIRYGVKEAKCEHCGIRNWRGQPAPLHLDHISGIRSDNRIENLRILCANCHSQTPTFGSKNRKKK